MKESKFQRDLVNKLHNMFPGCFIQRNPPGQTQGVPDLLILYNSKWAMLEVKASSNAPVRPNQEHYVSKFGQMSYAAFIYPENEERVLIELEDAMSQR